MRCLAKQAGRAPGDGRRPARRAARQRRRAVERGRGRLVVAAATARRCRAGAATPRSSRTPPPWRSILPAAPSHPAVTSRPGARNRASLGKLRSMSQLDELLDSLWTDHAAVAPQVARIHQLLRERDESRAQPAHRAAHLRCAGGGHRRARPRLRRRRLRGGAELRAAGAQAHRLRLRAPRRPPDRPCSISSLLVDELSREAQSLVRDLVGHLEPGAAAHPSFAISGRRWPLSASAYQQLRAESEYAAWVAAFGFRAHHFAVDASSLRTLRGPRGTASLPRGERQPPGRQHRRGRAARSPGHRG